MNVLEKILEEIKGLIEKHKNKAYELVAREPLTQCYTEADIEQIKVHELAVVRDIIRKHMDNNNLHEKCSRRKWYQKGYEDGKKDNDWIPYSVQNMPKKEDVYLVMCDDEEYPVKRMGFKKEDEYGLWYDDYGIYDGVILAWQPLPEPMRKE